MSPWPMSKEAMARAQAAQNAIKALPEEERLAWRQRRRDDEEEAWHLYVYGHNFLEISDKMKISPAQASRFISRAAKRRQNGQFGDVGAIKTQELARIDVLIEAWWKKYLADGKTSQKEYLQLLARKSKMLGLDAPVKFHHKVDRNTNHEGSNTTLEDRTVDLLRTLVSRGKASPVEKQYLALLEQSNTPVPPENYSQKPEPSDIGSDTIEAELVQESLPLEPEPQLLLPGCEDLQPIQPILFELPTKK